MTQEPIKDDTQLETKKEIILSTQTLEEFLAENPNFNLERVCDLSTATTTYNSSHDKIDKYEHAGVVLSKVKTILKNAARDMDAQYILDFTTHMKIDYNYPQNSIIIKASCD